MSETRVVAITGGGAGIGLAIAHSCAARGWTPLLIGRRASILEEARSELLAAAPGTSILACDISDDAAPQTILDFARERHGRLDVLVNNAGALLLEPLGEMTPAALDAIWRINLRAPYLLTAALVPLLRRGEDPAIVNIGSAAGLLYRPGQSAYGMTKAALHYLTRSLAVELAPDITVNAIIPGPVATDIHGDDEAGRSALDAIVATLPAGRAGAPHEVGEWVAHIADPANRWMTGVLLPVDGGRTITPPDRPLEDLT